MASAVATMDSSTTRGTYDPSSLLNASSKTKVTLYAAALGGLAALSGPIFLVIAVVYALLVALTGRLIDTTGAPARLGLMNRTMLVVIPVITVLSTFAAWLGPQLPRDSTAFWVIPVAAAAVSVELIWLTVRDIVRHLSGAHVDPFEVVTSKAQADLALGSISQLRDGAPAWSIWPARHLAASRWAEAQPPTDTTQRLRTRLSWRKLSASVRELRHADGDAHGRKALHLMDRHRVWILVGWGYMSAELLAFYLGSAVASGYSPRSLPLIALLVLFWVANGLLAVWWVTCISSRETSQNHLRWQRRAQVIREHYDSLVDGGHSDDVTNRAILDELKALRVKVTRLEERLDRR